MRLVIDVCGGEASPNEAIVAARKFKKKHDVQIILCGDKTIITSFLKKKDNFEILHAPEIVSPNESYINFLRNKNTSLYKATEYVLLNKADGVLSNSTTSAFVIITTALFKNIPGINRSAFMSYLPTYNQKGMMLLDVGANLEVDATDLVQFAQMASAYSKSVRKINKPSVSVLNIGTEDNKGFKYHQEAHKILKTKKDLNYLGFIEPTRFIIGESDIVVADGYSGNLALKSLEGTLSIINKLLKTEYKRPFNLFAALLSLPVIKSVKKKLSYVDNAGAFMVGINKIACKMHGNAKRDEIHSAIRMLHDAIKCNLVEIIRKSIK